MTTSVFYDTVARHVDLGSYQGASLVTTVGNATPKQMYDNINTLLDTGVTLVQQVNNSASTTNPNATFASTPTNGNAMIALVVRGADNVASTGPSGWTSLTATGAAGARRLEIWWKRAGASEAKLHTWTNATAALWEVTLIEFGGWASLVDPITVLTAANVTSGGSVTFNQTGILETVCAVVTSGGSAGTFTNNSTNMESTTDLPFTTTTRFRAMSIDAWTNRPTTSLATSQTASISWTTARPSTRAQVGWPYGTEDTLASYYTIGNNTQNTAGIVGQTGMSFNTASIPDGDTIASATLTLTSASIATYPTNSAVNIYSVSTISADNSNTRTVWRKPTELAALTRVATRAANSTWNASTAYAWTSDATFPAAISKTGSTHILIATNDQQAGTLRNTTEHMTLAVSGFSSHYLTVVHSFIGSATVAATTTMTPTVNRAIVYARTVASTMTASPTISRLITFARTINATVTTNPTVNRAVAYLRTITSSIDLTPTITRTVSIARTISATVTAIPSVLAQYVPLVPAITHKISLRVRSTISLVVPDRLQLKIRSRLRLPE